METPISIKVWDQQTVGILRLPNSYSKIVILLPSFTGNRTGPQRLFVELAREFYVKNIASLCMDIPEINYEDGKNLYKEIIVEYTNVRYTYLLKNIMKYIRGYNFNVKIILLSISFGCLPIYNFAKSSEITGLVLLSPDIRTNIPKKINLKNLYHYWLKLLNKDSLYKLFTFSLNIKSIYKNIFIFHHKQSLKSSLNSGKNNVPKVICIFGENDKQTFNECFPFFNKEFASKEIKEFECQTVENADHSFLGWTFKQDVIQKVTSWVLSS